MNILHVTTHLGGGAGKAISGIAIQGQQDSHDCHRILLLQAPEKEGWVQHCRENNVSVEQWDGTITPFRWADVIVVSWWNHPAMAKFLAEFPACPAARVLWCHVNGVYYPVLPFDLTMAFDRVMFTSRYSLQNPAWTAEEKKIVQSRASLVYGMGQFQPASMLPKSYGKKRKSFIVGYVGTLNYGKIHPDFVDFCKVACRQVPNLHFVMVGDRDAQLEQMIDTAGLTDYFTFTGFVNDAPVRMREFDVFGYLLNPAHYGTTENVLLEAMACGLPVIALRQNVEQFIVPQDAGFLVEDPQQYAQTLAYLSCHPEVCAKMGACAREHVIATYDAAQNAAEFRHICEEAICDPKEKYPLSNWGESPWAWFLACLSQRDRAYFLAAEQKLHSNDRHEQQQAVKMFQTCPPIFREKRKSSLLHFADTYPDNDILQSISTIIKQE